VRFLRHLVVACLVVAVVVVLGLAWNHFAASTLVGTVSGPGHGPVPGSGLAAGSAGGRARVIRPGGPHGPEVIRLGTFGLGLNSMLQLVNWPYLRHTVVIEAAVMAAVVIIDVGRRRSRQASRAAQLAQPPSGDGDGDGDGDGHGDGYGDGEP
jgi:hypothetical protein